MDETFLALVEKVDTTHERDHCADALRETVATYGLRHAAYLGISLGRLTRSEPYVAVTYSTDWIGHYRQREYVRIDPVVIEPFRTILPVDWRDLDWQGPRRRLLGESVEFGNGRQGLTVPIRGRHGDTALFSITSDWPDAEWARFKRQYLRDVQVLAFHIHQMVLRTEGVEHCEPRLAPRELECLQLAAGGKTFGEIASILSLRERTVKFYLELARHKLDSTNTTHAVAKALSMNLIRMPG